MPEFRHPDEAEQEAGGHGWSLSMLADGRHITDLGMAARRWRVEPFGRTTEWTNPGPEERFLYVISGKGAAHLAGQRLEIDTEDLIWLEPGDTLSLEAADRPLNVLDATSASGVGRS